MLFLVPLNHINVSYIRINSKKINYTRDSHYTSIHERVWTILCTIDLLMVESMNLYVSHINVILFNEDKFITTDEAIYSYTSYGDTV